MRRNRQHTAGVAGVVVLVGLCAATQGQAQTDAAWEETPWAACGLLPPAPLDYEPGSVLPGTPAERRWADPIAWPPRPTLGEGVALPDDRVALAWLELPSEPGLAGGWLALLAPAEASQAASFEAWYTAGEHTVELAYIPSRSDAPPVVIESERWSSNDRDTEVPQQAPALNEALTLRLEAGLLKLCLKDISCGWDYDEREGEHITCWSERACHLYVRSTGADRAGFTSLDWSNDADYRPEGAPAPAGGLERGHYVVALQGQGQGPANYLEVWDNDALSYRALRIDPGHPSQWEALPLPRQPLWHETLSLLHDAADSPPDRLAQLELANHHLRTLSGFDLDLGFPEELWTCLRRALATEIGGVMGGLEPPRQALVSLHELYGQEDSGSGDHFTEELLGLALQGIPSAETVALDWDVAGQILDGGRIRFTDEDHLVFQHDGTTLLCGSEGCAPTEGIEWESPPEPVAYPVGAVHDWGRELFLVFGEGSEFCPPEDLQPFPSPSRTGSEPSPTEPPASADEQTGQEEVDSEDEEDDEEDREEADEDEEDDEDDGEDEAYFCGYRMRVPGLSSDGPLSDPTACEEERQGCPPTWGVIGWLSDHELLFAAWNRFYWIAVPEGDVSEVSPAALPATLLAGAGVSADRGTRVFVTLDRWAEPDDSGSEAAAVWQADLQAGSVVYLGDLTRGANNAHVAVSPSGHRLVVYGQVWGADGHTLQILGAFEIQR